MIIRAMKTETGQSLRSRIEDERTPETIEDELTSEMVFNRGIAQFPSLWSGLRKLFTERGVTLKTHQRHRPICTVENKVFTSQEENENAIELLKRILNRSIRTLNSSGN